MHRLDNFTQTETFQRSHVVTYQAVLTINPSQRVLTESAQNPGRFAEPQKRLKVTSFYLDSSEIQDGPNILTFIVFDKL